jgi:hypothetical protein
VVLEAPEELGGLEVEELGVLEAEELAAVAVNILSH